MRSTSAEGHALVIDPGQNGTGLIELGESFGRARLSRWNVYYDDRLAVRDCHITYYIVLYCPSLVVKRFSGEQELVCPTDVEAQLPDANCH